jgi:hypothetical protein
MTTRKDFFGSARSPVDLFRGAGVDPASPAIEVVLDAAYACTPTKAQAKRWRDLSSMPWPTTKPRRIACCIGRRGLKTTEILAKSCVFEALCVAHEDHAAPGSRIFGIIICPKLDQAREAMRAVRSALDALAPLGVRYDARDAQGSAEVVLTSPRAGCEKIIRVVTADAVSVRGLAVFFAGFDEAAFLPSEDWLAVRDVDIVRAVSPSMIQFPEAMQLFASSPGRPGSYFHGLVEKPGSDVLVIRAPTWGTNPRITEAQCRSDAQGDAEVFEREYAARKFGAAGDSFIESALIWACLDSPNAGKGPIPGGRYVIGLDVAQLRDQTAIVICSSFEVEISRDVAPVRHVRVDHAEVITSSKISPTPIESIAARVRDLSRLFGGAPVLHDPFQGPTVLGALQKLGMRKHDDRDKPPSTNHVAQRGMSPTEQTPRWRSLRQLILGARLHLRAEDEPLVKQLQELKATQLSSGALKVEGRRDDLADALALAAEVALQLPPTGGPQGHVEHRFNAVRWGEEGITVEGSRWVRVKDGVEQRTGIPEWSPDFVEYAVEMLAQGASTPEINRWLARQSEAALLDLGITQRPINVAVKNP